MVAILLLFFSMMTGLPVQSAPALTTSETFQLAESQQLSDTFSMNYVNQHGQIFTIHWRKNAQPISLNINLYDAEHQSLTPYNLNNNFQSFSYHGRIEGQTESHIALMHVLEGQTEIILSSSTLGNIFIGKKKGEEIEYESEAPFHSQKISRTSCHPTEIQDNPNEIEFRSGAASTCKKVYLSITVDFDLYNQFGKNPTRVSNYVYSAISTVQAIYRLEEIQLGISDITIHTKEDGFRHITALDDLNFFRFVRRTFAGDIALCLSGFKDGTGFAPLGGHAFLSSLCLKTTSYAYVNVDGSYSSFPNFSWDIFGIAHELGHVLGSRHTHACVWGPHSNQALDDCAATEGGCLPGPPVSKGTIMSYCHLPGQPGISFASGFGKEPGDLIRAKIAGASCLSEYVPDQIQSKSPAAITANMECFDGTYTHYYYDNLTSNESDDLLLLSIKKNSQDIGHVYDGSLTIKSTYTSQAKSGAGKRITASYVKPGEKFFAAHKFWQITPSRQPSSPVQVKIPVSPRDIQDLDASVPQRVMADDVDLFRMTSPANPDPMTNHRNTTTSRIKMYEKGWSPSTAKYQHSHKDGVEYYEFQTLKLHGGGIGVYEQVVLPVDLLSFTGERHQDNIDLSWEVANQVALSGYVIERSFENESYQEIGFIPTEYDQSQYGFRDDENQGFSAFYRLKMINQDGSHTYSRTIYLDKGNPTSDIQLSTNMIPGDYIKIKLPGEEIAQIRLTHPSALIAMETQLNPTRNWDHILLPTGLISGVYLLSITQGSLTRTFKVFIQQ